MQFKETTKSGKQHKTHSIWHPIKNHQACKEAEKYDPLPGGKKSINRS